MLSIGSPEPLDIDRLRTLTDIGGASNCRWIVHPLGFSGSVDVRLEAPVPISLTPASLDLVVANLTQATEACGRPGLLEPITSLLRVPGTIAETSFLNRVCAQSGCHLLIDLTTLLVASRNHGFDPRSWLAEIDDGLIAGARIGGCLLRGERWCRDAEGEVDEAAWDLLGDLVADARPEVLIFEASRRAGEDDLSRELKRLRQLDARAPEATRQPGIAAATLYKAPHAPPAHRAAHPSAAIATTRIDIAPDVSFFVLDDHGVFLSESRRELVLFNTSAALLWCLLEDGTAVPGMIDAYRRAAGVSHDQAARDVGAVLQRWFGLGYTRTPAASISREVPLTTALAFVLTNPGLRRRFREAPEDVAADLGVVGSEVESFVHLDPNELDAQVAEFQHIRSGWREKLSPRFAGDHGAPAASAASPSGVSVPRPLFDTGRRYRLLATTFAVRCSSEAAAARVHEALGHLHSPTSEAQIMIAIDAVDAGRWIVFDDERPYRECRSIEEIVPVVLEIVRDAAVDRHEFLVKVHAGVVSMGTGCVLLPSGAGGGKTTLTAGLVHSGATYFSDEIAVLDNATLAVTPVPLPLSIKDGSLPTVRRLYPGVDALACHVREDFQRVRYMPPPPAALAGDRAEPVRWLVFPRYDPLAETVLRPLTRGAGLNRLLQESAVSIERLDRTAVAALVQWMRTVDCFELPMSSLEAAVSAVRAIASGRTT